LNKVLLSQKFNNKVNKVINLRVKITFKIIKVKVKGKNKNKNKIKSKCIRKMALITLNNKIIHLFIKEKIS
jgi:hypothetical protein